MVEVLGLESILLKLQKEREDRLKFEAERPDRKASFEKSFSDLSQIFVRALQPFYQRGLIDFGRQPSTFGSADFGNYAAEALTIRAGDRALVLAPKDGQAATLSTQVVGGGAKETQLILTEPQPGPREWTYRTQDFVGAVPSLANFRGVLTVLDEVSARFLVERLLSPA